MSTEEIQKRKQSFVTFIILFFIAFCMALIVITMYYSYAFINIRSPSNNIKHQFSIVAKIAIVFVIMIYFITYAFS